MEALLVERRFRCANAACGGLLILDVGRSGDALTLLKKYQDSRSSR
jgi:hypothetical protein